MSSDEAWRHTLRVISYRLLEKMATLTNATEAALFALAPANEFSEASLRTLFHIRGDRDASKAADRERARTILNELATSAIRKNADSVLPLGENKYCLISLMRTSGMPCAAVALVVLATSQEEVDSRMSILRFGTNPAGSDSGEVSS